MAELFPDRVLSRAECAALPDRCVECAWHVPTMGHQANCPNLTEEVTA